MIMLNKSELDQQIAYMRDVIPRIWWNLYQGSLQTGFNEQQAWNLLNSWILSQNPNGIRPNDIVGRPKSDTE